MKAESNEESAPEKSEYSQEILYVGAMKKQDHDL